MRPIRKCWSIFVSIWKSYTIETCWALAIKLNTKRPHSNGRSLRASNPCDFFPFVILTAFANQYVCIRVCSMDQDMDQQAQNLMLMLDLLYWNYLHVLNVGLCNGIIRNFITAWKQALDKRWSIVNEKEQKHQNRHIKAELPLMALGYHAVHSSERVGKTTAKPTKLIMLIKTV